MNEEILSANSGEKQENTFAGKLGLKISNLFGSDLFSDLTIKLKGANIKVHKLILSFRSDDWTDLNLDDIYELDWQDIEYEVGYSLLKWVYTDHVNLQNKSDQFVLGELRAGLAKFIPCEQIRPSLFTLR